MLRLNIRHRLPQIGMQITRGRVEKAKVIQPEIHTNNQQASSNKWITQPSIALDTSESQYVTGKRTMYQFTRERGQRGISDARASVSRHTQEAWARLDNGAKRGDDLASQFRSKMFEGYEAEPVFTLQWTKGAEVQVQESQLTGRSEVGDVTAEIQTTPSADVRISQGSVRTYIQDQGYLRQWTTEDYYDIYA